jgi:hypothetical protein
MNKSKIVFALGATALAVSVCLFTGCRKNDDAEVATEQDTNYANDQNMAEKMFDDANSISDKASVTTGSGAFKTSGCGTVTHIDSLIIVDFGTTNCLCTDGRYRRGKVMIVKNGAYADSGSFHTITFDNYYQNDNKIEGTKKVTNRGKNSLGQPYFDVVVNGTVTKTDGTVLTTSWTRVRTWTAGYNTPINWTDDVYSIKGTGTISRTGGTATVNIPDTAPLIVALNCRWIQAGKIVYTLPSGLVRTLNYGDTPACDNQATLQLPSGTVKTITLP